MFVFGVICLIAFANALPTPESEVLVLEPELHTNAAEVEVKPDNEKEDVVILSPIPEPPQLEPLLTPVILEVDGFTSPDKEKLEGEKDENKEGEEPEEQKPTVIKPPTFLTNLFPNLSWPFSVPFTLPSLPSWFGGRSIIYPRYGYLAV